MSAALDFWDRDAARVLGAFADIEHRVEEGRFGSRVSAATLALELRHAYVVLLVSYFQRFCRDLHTEAVRHVVREVHPHGLRQVFRERLLEGRKLDRGNPNPGNLGSDFARFGFLLGEELYRRDPRNRERLRALQELSTWRNAIAHQDFVRLRNTRSPPPLRVESVHRWRRVCDRLARELHSVVQARVVLLAGSSEP